jgi:hypothetical protein
MARSLTVETEDQPQTNWLLTGFVLLAIAFMAFGAIISMASADDAETPVVDPR